ncbi:MAG: MlaD family protein [Elusimicrobiota bacterium]|nr:MlaD family protein [Elusimicrobiota bacterium]
MSLEARVGAFVLGGLTLIATALFLLGDVTLERRYVLYVNFSDVGNLSKDAPVRLSGVEVGQVSEIELVDGGARVIAKVRHGVDVYNDAVFSVGSTGIIGSKFLQIDQGKKAAGTIPANSTIRGQDPVSIEKSLTVALEKLDKLLGDLTKDGPRGTLASNLTDTVANVREMTANLNDLIETTKPQLERAMARTDDITDKLDSLLAKSNVVMAGLATSSGTVGALLHDTKMKDDVRETIASVKEAAGTAKDVLGRINQFSVFWNYDWRYEHLVRTSRADIGLKISPRPGKYYYVGGANLANVSDDRRTSRHVDYVRPNKVDALIGWEGKTFDVALGVIRSGGGARLTVTPFHGAPVLDRVSFTAQAYDFGRNRVIEGKRFDKPQYDAGIQARVYKSLQLGGRVEDVAMVPRYQSWLKVMFEDQDIAYLLGMISFGAAGTRGRSKSK